MDLLQKLNQFLVSQAYQDKRPGSAAQRAEGYPFLTISREAGAGGHSLANALLDEMAKHDDPVFSEWKVFDAAFCARILADAKLMASLESLQKEETFSPWEEAVYELVGGRASTDRIYRKTFRAMKLLATMGKLIVIGRGGACATGDLPLGIHVRLVAPLAIRVERMRQQLQVSAANAERIVGEYDVERAKFVRAHFGQDVGDPLLYHAVWNASQVPFDEMAKFILEMIKTRAPKTVVA